MKAYFKFLHDVKLLYLLTFLIINHHFEKLVWYIYLSFPGTCITTNQSLTSKLHSDPPVVQHIWFREIGTLYGILSGLKYLIMSANELSPIAVKVISYI